MTGLKKHLYSCKTLFLIRCWFVGYYRYLELLLWKISGRYSSPPLLYKRSVIESYTKVYNTGVLVETGTYYGDMVKALKNKFDKVYSIELDAGLNSRAKWRFLTDSGVHLVKGDSGESLFSIIGDLKEPCIFWLDAHYSGGLTARGVTDSPVLKELGQISKSKFKNVILIDDARHFGFLPSYPDLDELKNFVSKHMEFSEFSVKDDIIRILP
ncbi:MAG: hypothetical protein WC988_03915 [Patescibacteria group bacterium]